MGTFFRVMVPVCVAMLLSVCVASPVPQETLNFDSLLEKDWKLIEVRQEDDNVSLDRSVMEADGLGDVFTLRFDDERISGKAFSNRYFGSYNRGTGQAITFGRIAATLIASFKELDAITEKEYFRYLEEVQSWNLLQGRLELYAVTSDNLQVILVFLE
jgi:heat shock protein HslJ